MAMDGHKRKWSLDGHVQLRRAMYSFSKYVTYIACSIFCTDFT